MIGTYIVKELKVLGEQILIFIFPLLSAESIAKLVKCKEYY